MITFQAHIQKFTEKGEKTGWSYIPISPTHAALLNPGVKSSYRVKGILDGCQIEKIALLPMGDGSFILPLNASLRKVLKKSKDDTLSVVLEVDVRSLDLDADFLECLTDEPDALAVFQQLTKSHQLYFSKWIESAKTTTTKTKRIATAVLALAKGMGFPEMLRAGKKQVL